MNVPAPTHKYEIELPDHTEKDRPNFIDFTEDKNGKVSLANTDLNLVALGEYHGLGFRFNMMSFQPEVYEICGDSLPVNLDQLRSKLISAASRYGLPKATIDDHLAAICQNNKYHPLKDWLDSAEWDGINRLDKVIDCLNAKHNHIAKIVMTRWLIGAVACLYEPIFKSKLVPVLQGGQSFKKTAFVERMALIMDHAFLEGAELNPDSKDSVLTCIRAWVVELGELERTSKNSQGSLKSFLSKALDTVRPPYARNDIQKPRQTNFIATVNGKDFLKDETGSTRFAVIEMNKAADMDSLNCLLGWEYDGTGSLKQTNPNLLKQFWLEVKALYMSGEGWQLTLAEVNRLALINDEFNDNGSWYEYIIGNYIEVDTKTPHLGWFTAGKLVEQDSNLKASETKLIGKALSKLEKHGLITSKKVSGNRRLYRF